MFKKGEILGTAMPADEVSWSGCGPNVRNVTSSRDDPSYRHFAELIQDVRKSAPLQLVGEAVELVNQYSDVFASSNLDLGDFTAIQHSIDTGNSRPIKQMMRRTPTVIQNEEQAHLEKNASGWRDSTFIISLGLSACASSQEGRLI